MSHAKTISLWGMAAFYGVAGANHFASPDFYLPMMPPYLPWHEALVFWSGVAEVMIGVGLLIPQTRVLAAWGAIALLIAVFPANLHVALNDLPVGGRRFGALGYLRLPFQAVFIAWAWWHTRPDPTGERAQADAAA